MIRKEVEKLRGLVLTPEELDFIQPIVETSKKMNYNQYLEDYRPEEESNDYYSGQVTCIDRQIAELQDRIATLEKKAEKESPKEVSVSHGTPGKGYWYICDWRP